ncbi:MAG TPA: hypothetical protein VE956_17520 [Nodularia sp. (in: cyanobacteria)]|nr:hypothetical protein [Nodularia sp. (in: cyanobacteria)]
MLDGDGIKILPELGDDEFFITHQAQRGREVILAFYIQSAMPTFLSHVTLLISCFAPTLRERLTANE